MYVRPTHLDRRGEGLASLSVRSPVIRQYLANPAGSRRRQLEDVLETSIGLVTTPSLNTIQK